MTVGFEKRKYSFIRYYFLPKKSFDHKADVFRVLFRVCRVEEQYHIY